jgi:hypothetical protein
MLLPLLGYGQPLAHQVTNLAGAEALVSGYVLSASVGEPAILTFTSNDFVLTQGFLQPEVLPCEEVSFRYYPNPAREQVTIEAYGCETTIVSVQVVDLWGRLLPTQYVKEENSLRLTDLSQGVYFVHVRLTSGTTHTIQLVKTGD